MKLKLILFLSSILSFTITKGQDTLFLQHKTKENKLKIIDLEKEFFIKTKDTIYKNKKIVNFNDSSIFLTRTIKTNKDTTYTTYRYSKKGSIPYEHTVPIYKQDTFPILFQNIQSLKTYRFEKRGWLILPAKLAIFSIVAIPFLPIAAIDSGMEGVRNWLLAEAILVGASYPPLLIGTSKIAYNLQEKWSLIVKKTTR